MYLTIYLKVFSQMWQEKTLQEKTLFFKTYDGMHQFIKKYAHRITILSIERT